MRLDCARPRGGFFGQTFWGSRSRWNWRVTRREWRLAVDRLHTFAWNDRLSPLDRRLCVGQRLRRWWFWGENSRFRFLFRFLGLWSGWSQHHYSFLHRLQIFVLHFLRLSLRLGFRSWRRLRILARNIKGGGFLWVSRGLENAPFSFGFPYEKAECVSGAHCRFALLNVLEKGVEFFDFQIAPILEDKARRTTGDIDIGAGVIPEICVWDLRRSTSGGEFCGRKPIR